MDPQDLTEIHRKLDKIGEALWGHAWKEPTPDPEKIKEMAERFREKREEDLKRVMEARIRAGKSDAWDADDELASQMS